MFATLRRVNLVPKVKARSSAYRDACIGNFGILMAYEFESRPARQKFASSDSSSNQQLVPSLLLVTYVSGRSLELAVAGRRPRSSAVRRSWSPATR